MNKTVTITSKNHKYQNTYGEISVSRIFVLTIHQVTQYLELYQIGRLTVRVKNKWTTVLEATEKG